MRVLVIPDLHAPYHNPLAECFIKKLIKQHRPNKIVNLGDEADCHSWSRWAKSPAAMGASEELKQAAKTLHRIFDDYKVEFCNSNHIERASKRQQEAGVPDEFLVKWSEVIGAPANWRWADSWEFDGVRYQHGDGYSGINAALHAAQDNGQSTCIGHLHGNAGIVWRGSITRQLFGMHAGCLVDPRAPVFDYGKHSRTKPMLGAGVVVDGVPQWYPL
jgi:hypothetical protein